MEEKEVTTSGQTTPDVKEEPKKVDINQVSREELIGAINQLNQMLHQANAQITRLKMQLDSIDWTNMRLSHLFKVLEFSSKFNDPDYIISVCEEIKDLMTIKEEEPENKEK